MEERAKGRDDHKEAVKDITQEARGLRDRGRVTARICSWGTGQEAKLGEEGRRMQSS